MKKKKCILHLRLFGAFSAQWSDGKIVEIRGNKQRGLIAVLATAAAGKHTRGWLQETLWGRSGAKHGRANLRRMLSDLKIIFAKDFDLLFNVDHADIQLNLDNVSLEGDIRDGDFLAGIDIWEDGFRNWLHEKREHYKYATSTPVRDPVGTVPTITIVPFLSIHQNDVEQHLSDVVALEVSRALSRSSMINVISHLSSRVFSGKVITLSEIKQDLNVDYLATGSIRVKGQEFSIDVDLISADSGKIIWTRSFSGVFGDIFENRRGTAYEIANQVGQGILSASVELAKTHPLPNIESHALLMSAIKWLHSNDIAEFNKSYELLTELTQNRRIKDAHLYAWTAFWHLQAIPQGWSSDAAKSTLVAIECANRALDINPMCAFSLTMEGMARNNASGDQEVGKLKFSEAIEIEPNNAMAWLCLARHHSFIDQSASATKIAEHALSLSPIGPQQYLFDTIASTAYLAAGDYAKSLKLIERSLDSNVAHKSSLRVRAIALELMGKHTEATHTMDWLLQLDPSFSVAQYRKNHPAADSNNGKIWCEALARAGLPLK